MAAHKLVGLVHLGQPEVHLHLVKLHPDIGQGRIAEGIQVILGQRAQVLLAGHTDTVPFDEGGWSKDPFKVTEEGNRLYGLGTIDMKGLFAFIVEALKEIDLKTLDKPLRILATADEETTMAGARAIANQLRARDIWIRDFDGAFADYLRITVGTREENARLFAALKELI